MNKLVKPFVLIFAVALSSSAFSQQVDNGHELKQQGVRKISEKRLAEPREPRGAQNLRANSGDKLVFKARKRQVVIHKKVVNPRAAR